jgi:hypothetical protein
MKITKDTITVPTTLGDKTYRHYGSGKIYGWEVTKESKSMVLSDKESEQVTELLRTALKKYYKNK